MQNRLNKTERLHAIVNRLFDGNKSAFSREMSVSQQAVSSWFIRGTFPVFEIAEKFPQINCQWLLTGEGDMLEPSADVYKENQHITLKLARTCDLVEKMEDEIKYLREENERLKEEKVVHLTISMKGNKLSVTTDRE